MSEKEYPDFHGFCYCGLQLYKDACGNLYCGRHKYNIVKAERPPKRGRYSGPSKSKNSWNDYK